MLGQSGGYHKGMYFKIPNKREIRYAWNAGGPVITTSIIIACVAVWLVEIVTRAFMPTVSPRS